ncbi:MAG: TraB/GumN family protein [Deltaproteobacteria bacterium]
MSLKTGRKQSLLWQVYNPNSTQYSYLYGTIHLRDNSVYFLIEKLRELIKNCDTFIAEYDLDNNDQTTVMQAMQIPDNKHLRNYMTERKYARLKKSIEKAFNIDIDRFGFLKPIAIENMITEKIFNSDYDFPMDFELWNYANAEGKKTLGAESTESQIHILMNLSIRNQIKSLLKIGKNTSKYKNKIKKIVKYYKDQEIKQLYKISIKALGRFKGMLVYDRNHRITEKMATCMENGTVFVAVGAGHLPGKYGILRLLKQKGFSIRPMKVC